MSFSNPIVADWLKNNFYRFTLQRTKFLAKTMIFAKELRLLSQAIWSSSSIICLRSHFVVRCLRGFLQRYGWRPED